MKNDETSVRPLFNKLVLIGVGLIGGSFALALKKAGMVRHIVGLDRHQAALEEAQQLGIIDSHTVDLASALEGADVIVIATPVAQTTKILEAIYPLLQAHTVVTDVGSTKTDVVMAARQALKEKVNEVNALMKQLGEQGVDVRISYIESSKSKDIAQGISIWRIEQHINFL